ncbi:MAG: oligosaccharide flippase family protein [Ekhidna sp.]|uniref:oligosaccharide flippase family protein n=1 Tax=Ekhidna sp. TaxID=2608089 RepID=UPI0032F06D59
MIKKLAALWRSFLKKDSFVQNFSYLASGKILVATASFFFVPVLSRLFPPEAYGNFSLFNSITTLIVTLLLMGYPGSYVLVSPKKAFQNLIIFQILKVCSATFFALLVIGFLYLISPNMLRGSIWLFIPIGIFVDGSMVIFSSWNVREKEFRLASKLEGFGGIFLRSVNVLFGWLGRGYVFGLICGNLIGRFVVNVINSYRFYHKEVTGLRSDITFQGVKRVLHDYSNYPKYFLPNQLLGLFAGQIPIYFLAIRFDNQSLGYYGMALTLFSLPQQLFVNAIAPLFLQKANELIESGFHHLQSFTIRLYRTLFLVLIPPIVILVVFSRDLVIFFLGDQWETTGSIVAMMGIYVLFQYTIFPIQSVFQIFKKERFLFFLSAIGNLLMVLGLAIGLYLNVSFIWFIVIISGTQLISYLLNSYFVCRTLEISFLRNVLLYGAVFILFIISFYLFGSNNDLLSILK